MVSKDFLVQLEGYGLTTAEIHYHMPDHPKLLQQFIWQDYDLAPLFPGLKQLLAFWQADYPESMREICETLLAKAVRDVDAPTRAKLRVQLCSQPGLAHRVLPRGSQPLIEAARTGTNLAPLLAESLGVDGKIAHEILEDESGAKLAVACKAACMDRSVFSAL